MTSEIQTRYGVGLCCHGRLWRPWTSNQASRRSVNSSGLRLMGCGCVARRLLPRVQCSGGGGSLAEQPLQAVFLEHVLELLLELTLGERLEIGPDRGIHIRPGDFQRDVGEGGA